MIIANVKITHFRFPPQSKVRGIDSFFFTSFGMCALFGEFWSMFTGSNWGSKSLKYRKKKTRIKHYNLIRVLIDKIRFRLLVSQWGNITAARTEHVRTAGFLPASVHVYMRNTENWMLKNTPSGDWSPCEGTEGNSQRAIIDMRKLKLHHLESSER